MYTFIISLKSGIWNSVGGPPDLKGHAYKVVLSMRESKGLYPKVNNSTSAVFVEREKYFS